MWDNASASTPLRGLLFGLFAWLSYLGFEPAIRRAWPRLLIASTRLLDGRWRGRG
jgi:hypothetical protein